MEQLKIQTTQNVEIGYEIANIGDRLLAALIDLIIIASYLLVTLLIPTQVFATNKIFFLLIILPINLYDVLFEIFMDGQTPGKKIRNLKVVRVDGSQATIGNYLLRWLLRPIDVLMSLGTVAITVILWNGRGQRLGDILANTTVIQLTPRASLEDTILTAVQDNYTLQIPQVGRLKDEDITTVKEVIQTYQRLNDPKLKKILAKKLRLALEERLQVPLDLPAEHLFEAILKDYNYLKSQ